MRSISFGFVKTMKIDKPVTSLTGESFFIKIPRNFVLVVKSLKLRVMDIFVNSILDAVLRRFLEICMIV